jgi:osmotically-inducible protein OsmY
MTHHPDSDVSKEVRAAFELDPRVDQHRFPIHVVNHGDRLRLEGEVENIAAKRVAIALAKKVSGMTRVIDALRLAPGESRGDGEVRDAFARSLLRQSELKNCNIRQRLRAQVDLLHKTSDPEACGEIEFETSEGVITLNGSVISLSHKRMVEALAWWVPGCRDVVNQLEVVPAEEDNDDELADAVRLVFEIDPLVHADQIGIRAEDGVVTLAGVLHRSEERRMAEMDAWSVWGVLDVHNLIEVSPA